MAFRGKYIVNTKTGQGIRFLQTATDTGGALLEMESTFNPHSTEPVAHYHQYQQEDFTVLSGEIKVRMEGQVRTFREGDKFHIPPGRVHSMWNDSDSVASVNWQVRPAMNTEYLLETGIGLANAGKVGANGMPGILQVAAMANHFHRVYRAAKPPYPIQRTAFFLLKPLAMMLGYKPMYPEYID